MLISVVLTFYNQRIYVRRALKSVLQQTHAELDIIVVDDGSDENIESRVHEFSDDRVRFFRKENGGVSSARNFGIEKAHGMYIAILDGDDVYLPGRIKTMLEFLRQNGYPICLATCGAYIFVKNGHFIGRVRPHDYPVGDIINSSLVRPSCTMYHCDVFTRLGGFPEHLKSNEDGALNSIAAQFFPIYSVDQSLVLYQSDNSGLARRDLDIFDNAVKVLITIAIDSVIAISLKRVPLIPPINNNGAKVANKMMLVEIIANITFFEPVAAAFNGLSPCSTR